MKIYPIDLKLKLGMPIDGLSYLVKKGVLNVLRENDFSKKEFCFNYALKNNRLDNCESSYNYMIKRGYINIEVKNVRAGDIAVFYKLTKIGKRSFASGALVKHYAVVKQCNYKKSRMIINSKWGLMAVYSGPINYLPKIYGNNVAFFRNSLTRKSEVSQKIVGSGAIAL